MSEPTDAKNSNPIVKWGKPQPVKVRQSRVSKSGFTSGGQDAVVLFDDLKAELNGPVGGLHAVSMVAFQLPVRADLKKGFLGFLVHLRGASSVSAGGRVSLMVSVNGRAEVAQLNLVEGTVADVQVFHEQFVVEQRGPAETNPNVLPLEPVFITLTLVAKRAAAEDYAVLAVDDVSILACLG